AILGRCRFHSRSRPAAFPGRSPDSSRRSSMAILRSLRAALCGALMLALCTSSPAPAADDAAEAARLAKALTDDVALVRKQAAIARGELGSAAREAVPALRAALKDPDAAVRAAAAEALEKIGRRTLDELARLVRDEKQDREKRRAACRELGE